MKARMRKAFIIHARSVAAPLSFDEARVKYRATAEDVRAVKLFLVGDSTTRLSKSIGRKRARPSSGNRRSRSTPASGTRKK